MAYREKWWQLGRKKLKFPSSVIKEINDRTVSLEDYLYHKMYEQGVGIDCIIESERQVAEKFGIEKLKNLDMELIITLRGRIDCMKILLDDISESVEDVNLALYDAVKDLIQPSLYSTAMREVYRDRVLEVDTDDEDLRRLKSNFENGYLDIRRIIDNWQLLKDKNLSLCLSHDENNKNVGLTDSELKKFMNDDMDKYRDLYDLLFGNYNKFPRGYKFIREIATSETEDLRKEITYKYANELLLENDVRYNDREFRIIFKYFPFVDYLRKNYAHIAIPNLLSELVSLPTDYICNIPFSIKTIKDAVILGVLDDFGIKNIVDFDNECGHIFTANDCELLKSLFMYRSVYFPDERSPYLIGGREPILTYRHENDRIYTKEEFYEAMRRIILYGKIPLQNHSMINGEFREKNPDLFLSENAPKELQEAFYEKSLTPSLLTKLINENKDNMEFLRDKHISSIMEPIFYTDFYTDVNFYEALEKYFKNNNEEIINFIMEYSEVLEIINTYAIDRNEVKIVYGSIEKLKDSLDQSFVNLLETRGFPYPKNIPNSIHTKYERIFLNSDIPELQEKFYNRLLTAADFEIHPEWLRYFDNINVAYGFQEDILWTLRLFGSLSVPEANGMRLKTASEFAKIPDLNSAKFFKDYIIKHENSISKDKIQYVSELLNRLYYSNSTEMHSFRKEFAEQLLETDDPIENCKKIEKIFLQNNLPLFGKMFLTFQTLYPGLAHKAFMFDNESRMAPELKNSSLPKIGHGLSATDTRLAVIFNDLLRISYCSQEKSFIEYLNNIETGNEIFLHLQNGDYKLEDLPPEMKKVLEVFVSHLEVLYKNTPQGKTDDLDISGLSIEEKSRKFNELFKTTNLYDLKDRIVRTYCFTAGVKSFEELKKLTADAYDAQLERRKKILAELEANNGVFEFEEGDFVRCIGYYESLAGSLKNGNFCKEHLGSILGTSASDTTPLDIDVTRISEKKDIYHAIAGTPTGFGFGNVFLIFKKDNPNLNITRDSEGNLTGAEYDPRKVEAFGTRVGSKGWVTHWGFRTGCSIKNDPDLILYKSTRAINDSKPYNDDGTVNYVNDANNKENIDNDLRIIKFALAKEGTYIPVIDFAGRLIYTLEEFNLIRSKMQGLSYYGNNDYQISDNLVTPEIEKIASEINEDSVRETHEKRSKVCDIIAPVLKSFNLETRYSLGEDLTGGFAELIDTGSTGRDTNIPHDGDFDFFLRLDAEIMRNANKLQELRERLMEAMKVYPMQSEPTITDRGDLRFKGVGINDKIQVDIDISFGVKTNKVAYSSDLCLKDRLNTIRTQNPDKYKYVVANIIQAKEVLKKAGVYKPRRTDSNQGGIGGVGVENWILQNGGSFIDAATSFVKAAEGRSFEKFKDVYQIWDFGENHFAAREGDYLHDNFVANNMNKEGYEKMVNALKEYLKNLDIDYSNGIRI